MDSNNIIPSSHFNLLHNKPPHARLLLTILMFALLPFINLDLAAESEHPLLLQLIDLSRLSLSMSFVTSLILYLAATAISFRIHPAKKHYRLARYRLLLGLIWSTSWILGKLPAFGVIPKERLLICFIAALLFFSWCAHWFICLFLSLHIADYQPKCHGHKPIKSIRNLTPIDLAPAIILLCWLPWLIALYPGVFAPNDTLDQLQQFFGYQSWTSSMIGQLSPEVYLNNHHPVLHTILLGSFVSVGNSLGSANVGLFCFVLFQVSVEILGICLLIKQCRKLNIDTRLLYVAIAFISLNPLFPILSSCVTKDTLFTGLFLIFIAEATRSLRTALQDTDEHISIFRRLPLPLVLSGLFASLLRQTMVYVYIVVLVLLVGAALICWLQHKTDHRKMLSLSLCGIAIIVASNLAIVRLAYPLANIAGSSEAETLAVPIAQITRYATTSPDEFYERYSSEVEKVLDLNSFNSYYPANIDSVKNARKTNASSEDYKALIDSWASILLKDPGGAIRAWVQLCRSYFSLSYSYSYIWTDSFSYPAGNSIVDHLPHLNDMGLTFHESGLDRTTRAVIANGYEQIIASPLAVPFNMGLYAWLLELCLVCSVIKRNPISIAVFSIAFLLLGTLLFSPADSLLRYIVFDSFYF